MPKPLHYLDFYRRISTSADCRNAYEYVSKDFYVWPFRLQYDQFGVVTVLFDDRRTVSRTIPFTDDYNVYAFDSAGFWTLVNLPYTAPVDRCVWFPSEIELATGYTGYLAHSAAFVLKSV